MEQFKFGDKILVSGTLTRVKNGQNRTWERDTTETKEAIFLGYRTLANGKQYTDYNDEEGYGGLWFDADKYFRAALICEHNRKPRYASLEDIIRKNEE